MEGATHLSGSILDMVLSSNPGMVQKVEMIRRIGSSDHETIVVQIQSDVMTRRASCLSLDLNRANFEEMRRELRIDWEKELSGLDPNSMWGAIKGRVNQVIETHVPMRRNRKVGRPKWLNGKILTLIGKKRKAWFKWKACASPENKRA